MVTFRGMDEGVYVTVHEPDGDNVQEPKLLNLPPASPSEKVTKPVRIGTLPPGPAPSPTNGSVDTEAVKVIEFPIITEDGFGVITVEVIKLPINALSEISFRLPVAFLKST